MIGLITLDEKCAGARSAGNPHAACEAEGTGNGVTDHPTRARRGKPRTQPSAVLRATAPVLDPTAIGAVPAVRCLIAASFESAGGAKSPLTPPGQTSFEY